MARVSKRSKTKPEEPSEVNEFWRNPIFQDPDAFIARVEAYIDIFGSAQIALPRRGSKKKFIDQINQRGYRMEPINADESSMLGKNQIKKLKFYEISKA